jgi:hypothetical protein
LLTDIGESIVEKNVKLTDLEQKVLLLLTDGVCYLPFSSPKPSRKLGLVYQPSSAKKTVLEGLVELCR